MDTDNTKKTKSGKWIGVISVVIFLCSLFIIGLLLEVSSKLEQHNKILLTVPPELKQQIVAICRQTAEDIKVTGTNSVNTALEHIKDAADNKLAVQESAICTQLKIITETTASVAETTKQNQNVLAAIAGERAAKADAYLKAARAAKGNPEIAQILYVSSLSFSSEKSAILNEFIDWQEKFIRAAIKENNLELARERLMALASVCDANISTGSVGDMETIPALKQKLAALEQEITKQNAANIAKQQEKLNQLEQKIETVSSFDEAEQLLKEITDVTCDSSLNKQKDAMVARIIQKQSCLTTPTQSLMLPAVNADTPWCAWLGNFVTRLKSDLPVSKKLEDIGTASELLQAAKQSSMAEVKEKISEIEIVSREIYVAYWQERVDQALTAAEPNINDISTLLAECNTFNKDEQKKNVDRIVKLNKLITKATLKELTEGNNILKKTEIEVSAEAFVQMVGATQSQYMQILLRLQGLQEKYPNQFTQEISDVSKQIAYLGQLQNAYKSKLIVSDLRKAEEQRKSFVKWAKSQLEIAKRKDEAGEKVADEYFATRSNERAVNQYVEAWQTLMSIHPGDLSSADPALYQSYDELKKKIENHWTPNDFQRKRVRYKRITDF